MYEPRILTQRINAILTTKDLGFFISRMGVVTALNTPFTQSLATAGEPSKWLSVDNVANLWEVVYQKLDGTFGVKYMIPNKLYPIIATQIVSSAVINGITFTTTLPTAPGYIFWYGGQ